MHKLGYLICFFCLLSFGRGQSFSTEVWGSPTQVIAKMEWVERVSVEKFLAQSLASNPLFLATDFNGNLKIPGLSKKQCLQIVRNNNFKIMPGMAEVVYNAKHASLRVKTRIFAERYNQMLFKRVLQKRGANL